MYDKREPYHIASKALTFNFNPNRFEIWASGKKIDEGAMKGIMQCIPSILSESQSEVKFFDLPERLNIRQTLLFDMTFTGSDRIFFSNCAKKNKYK